ncbi:MAG: hypothetical protein E7046_03410 [Lentisphaerae bacterium]|nr:hypothetical protein [Lentisphaerota bacterium]
MVTGEKALFRCVSAVIILVCASFRAFSADCRPETWFHVIGGNASKKGLTADLESLADAGFGGIQFFHGQLGKARVWDGVTEQIPCLSEKWDDLVKHVADECARLGMTFKMQNCPGWSMSGGPWIASSNAMRKLVFARQDVAANPEARDVRRIVPDIPVPREFRDIDSDWKDVCILAFPTPEGGALPEPLSVATNGNCRTIRFGSPVTIRTIELPSPGQMNQRWAYNSDVRVVFEAKVDDVWRKVCDVRYPQGCWQDRVPFTIACEEAVAKEWRLSLWSSRKFNLRFARFHSEARFDNYEGLAGHVLRGHLKRNYPKQSYSAYVRSDAVRVVKVGDELPVRALGWTVLRVGHVNMKKKNAPAPAEATGWECDKLDPRGIEANFAGYIGRLVDGPLKGGRLDGMIVDSWECERQTWTWRMEEWFKAANGYDVKTILPAVFGWVLDSPEKTDSVLLDWRKTVSGLIAKNYYGRMSELAHAKGLSVAYETAFGDVLPGDILEYWKYCDTPMCEFWQPYDPVSGGAGHPNYKPVRPCVSAAHLYGKRRVDCESFTSMRLTWDENFRDLKEQAVRHFARGVTHLVFHTFTHNPHTDGRVPGTSFGSYIGTPFLRGQTWWRYMRSFTDWTAKCCEFLERGYPVVDVLRYLGDEIDHKPDELESFPEGFKNDYLNADVLFNRLDVKDGRFILPDGMSYSVVWVPDSVTLLPATRRRLEELSAKGGRVHFGSADGAVAGLLPQLEVQARPDQSGEVLWYHRIDGDRDCFFVGADGAGFSGDVSFRTVHGLRRVSLGLSSYETVLLEFSRNEVVDFSPGTIKRNLEEKHRLYEVENIELGDWRVSFPSGWGTPEHILLERLTPWKDMPGMSDEGRAFSGTAAYETEFNVKSIPEGLFELDLGVVRDFARVFLNGDEVTDLWAMPYRCDVSKYVKPGRNSLKVEVTSTWFNRLAYDFAQNPQDRKTWTVWKVEDRPPPCLKRGAKLRASGLIGPVRLSLRSVSKGAYRLERKDW